MRLYLHLLLLLLLALLKRQLSSEHEPQLTNNDVLLRYKIVVVGPDKGGYYHKFFVRGDPDSVRKICRRRKNEGPRKPGSVDPDFNAFPMVLSRPEQVRRALLASDDNNAEDHSRSPQPSISTSISTPQDTAARRSASFRVTEETLSSTTITTTSSSGGGGGGGIDLPVLSAILPHLLE